MINVFYNSKDFLDWVAGLPRGKNIVQNYSTKNTHETNILNDLQKLLNSSSTGQAYDTIINAGSDFKQEFGFTPVRDAISYFQGALPTIDENKITNFITKIMAQQRMALAH